MRYLTWLHTQIVSKRTTEPNFDVEKRLRELHNKLSVMRGEQEERLVQLEDDTKEVKELLKTHDIDIMDLKDETARVTKKDTVLTRSPPTATSSQIKRQRNARFYADPSSNSKESPLSRLVQSHEED